MLASLMSRNTSMKRDIENKLSAGFTVLMDQSYPVSGQFFLSKQPYDIDAAELTYYALRSINLYNEMSPGNKVLGLKKRELIDYFTAKTIYASSTGNLKQALTSIKGAQFMINRKS